MKIGKFRIFILMEVDFRVVKMVLGLNIIYYENIKELISLRNICKG